VTGDELEVVEAMRREGGGFVASLAEAFAHADPINFARLRLAFPDYWSEYERAAAVRRQVSRGELSP